MFETILINFELNEQLGMVHGRKGVNPNDT